MERRGFTLIELLVVISIIGILSSFAVISLNAARTKARDALRKGDMAQLRTAMALLYDDLGAYPTCNPGNAWNPGDPSFGTDGDIRTFSGCYSNLTANLASGAQPLLMSMPVDPQNKNNKVLAEGGSDIYIYRYITNSTGSQYALIYYLEENGGTLQVVRGF